MITTLTGTNSFQLKTRLDKAVKDFSKTYGDMALEKIDCEEADYPRITTALQNLPFLAGKKLVVLKNPSASNDFKENFEELLKTIPDTTQVIIIETNLDKRLSYAKNLKKLTEYKEYKELPSEELPGWLQERAKNKGGNINPGDARYLVERLGPNQQMLSTELDKLLAYNSEISRQSIDMLTEERPQSTIFQLVDAACAGDVKRALKLYEEQRRLKVEPIAIIGMLAWQFQVMGILVTAGKMSPDQIAKETKLHPYVIRKNLPAARRLGFTKLKKHISELYELETLAKSAPIDVDEALQTFIVGLGV